MSMFGQGWGSTLESADDESAHDMACRHNQDSDGKVDENRRIGIRPRLLRDEIRHDGQDEQSPNDGAPDCELDGKKGNQGNERR
jgi:hypothetical protein